MLLAAAGLFAVLAGTGGAKPRPWLDLPLAAVMGLAAGHLLLFPGIPRGHDTMHHLWGVWAVAREASPVAPVCSNGPSGASLSMRTLRGSMANITDVSRSSA